LSVTPRLFRAVRVTNSEQCNEPPDIDESSTRALVAYLRQLGRPPTARRGDRNDGGRLFRETGCAACHTPCLSTTPIVPNAATTCLPAYTDLLLHDMGAALAEAGGGHAAARSEFRTPPLWGVAATGPPYLHDGRASSLEDAIANHDGEASVSRTRYERLDSRSRVLLLAFLRSL
jgi:CxxC motif-containing protein (DUF1111 family)